MTPKIVDKESKRKEIAMAALDLFAHQGFDATSISQVAKAAGIGKGTVYEYFSTKEELMTAAYQGWVEELEQVIMARMAGGETVEDRFRAMVRAIMQAFVEDERTGRLMIAMFQLILQSDDLSAHHKMFMAMTTGTRDAIAAMILEGVSTGEFHPSVAKDATKIAINLFAFLDGIGVHYMLTQNYCDIIEQTDFYMNRLIESLKKP